MKYRRRFLFVITIILIIQLSANAQQEGIRIPIPLNISSKKFEYSALATSGKKIYLVPQYPSASYFKDAAYFFALNTDSIGIYLETGIPFSSYDSIYISNFHYPDYFWKHFQGFEAAVITGDSIFLAVETSIDSDSCYIIYGKIKNDTIAMVPQRICGIPKLQRHPSTGKNKLIANAGFESLTYLPTEKKLLAIFEYNNFPGRSTAYTIAPSLEQQSVKAKSIRPIDLRITDITLSGNIILAINFYFYLEYDEYISGDTVAIPDLKNKNLRNTCYCRIVSFEPGTTSWKQIRKISNYCENWEGLIPFKDGVLMITDEHPESKLVYFSLKN